MHLARNLQRPPMALMTLTEAARELGYASRSQLRRLRDEGRIDDFTRKTAGRELIEMEGLKDHIASIIGQRASGNVCQTNAPDIPWGEVAELVNRWLDPKCWSGSYPFTAQQIATLSVCTKDAIDELCFERSTSRQ